MRQNEGLDLWEPNLLDSVDRGADRPPLLSPDAFVALAVHNNNCFRILIAQITETFELFQCNPLVVDPITVQYDLVQFIDGDILIPGDGQQVFLEYFLRFLQGAFRIDTYGHQRR